WNSAYHSQSLRGLSFDLPKNAFSDKAPNSGPEDVQLGENLAVHRVALKVPMAMHGFFSPRGRGGPPPDRAVGPPAPDRSRSDPLPRSAIYVQCAFDVAKREA